MFCTKCGREVKEDAVFCEYCGNRVGKSPEENEQKENTSNNNESALDNNENVAEPNNSEQKKSTDLKKLVLIGAPILTFVIVAVVVCLIIFKPFSKDGDVVAGTDAQKTDTSAGGEEIVNQFEGYLKSGDYDSAYKCLAFPNEHVLNAENYFSGWASEELANAKFSVNGSDVSVQGASDTYKLKIEDGILNADDFVACVKIAYMNSQNVFPNREVIGVEKKDNCLSHGEFRFFKKKGSVDIDYVTAFPDGYAPNTPVATATITLTDDYEPEDVQISDTNLKGSVIDGEVYLDEYEVNEKMAESLANAAVGIEEVILRCLYDNKSYEDFCIDAKRSLNYGFEENSSQMREYYESIAQRWSGQARTSTSDNIRLSGGRFEYKGKVKVSEGYYILPSVTATNSYNGQTSSFSVLFEITKVGKFFVYQIADDENQLDTSDFNNDGDYDEGEEDDYDEDYYDDDDEGEEDDYDEDYYDDDDEDEDY